MMDGSTAGNGPGPRIMYPTTKNVILASADQVAIDAVAAKMMGFDPMTIDYIRIAHEQGLGVGDPSEIEIVGDVEIAQESGGSRSAATCTASWAGWPGSARRRSSRRRSCTRRSSRRRIMFSEVFHDYYHWPLKERKVYERWLEESPWGHLFAKYERRGRAGAVDGAVSAA